MAETILTDELLYQACRQGAATLHEAAGQLGALPSALGLITPGLSCSGRALTVSGPPGDNLWIHRALASASRGDVLVVSVGGYYEAGYWGEILSWAARSKFLAGVVVDGCARDGAILPTIGFPVFARGLCIRGTRKDADGRGAINEAVTIGDVVIHTGDLVVGDADGVVVIPAASAEGAVEAGERRLAREASIIAELQRGANTIELLGLPR